MLKKPSYLLLSLIFLLLTALTVMVWLDPLKNYLASNHNQRKILSSLYFHYPDVTEHGFQVIKFKHQNKIYVDIYKVFPNNNFVLLNQIDTKTKFEGHFLLGSNATNLALVDADDDGRSDILVPSFDKNLVAYLNVLKYDLTTQNFEVINEIIELPR